MNGKPRRRLRDDDYPDESEEPGANHLLIVGIVVLAIGGMLLLWGFLTDTTYGVGRMHWSLLLVITGGVGVLSGMMFLAAYGIYVSCKRQWIILETGGEDGLFGYDFSQGYTSLERDEMPTAPPRRRKSWFQRWLERRREARAKRDEEQRAADETRLDELLAKVQREGMTALTDEERRFMKRVSDRYRNRL